MPSVVAETYERVRGRWKLVVRHEFMGDTLPKARAVMRAHKRFDSFLRSCTEGNPSKFGNITCHTQIKERP